MTAENNGKKNGGITGKGWQPGQSGNPGGRPKGLASQVREVATAEALAEWQWAIWQMDLQALERLNIDPKDVTLEYRQRAHQWLTERGHGKAPSYEPVIGADPLDRNELDQAIAGLVDELAGRRKETPPGPAADGKLADTG